MGAKVLLAISPDRRDQLVSVLQQDGLEYSWTGSLREALVQLSGEEHVDLLVVDEELSDGSWRDALEYVLNSGAETEVLVSSRCGDELLWAEVIQCGAFELLPEPFEQQEILRIVHNALDSRYMTLFSNDRKAQTRAS